MFQFFCSRQLFLAQETFDVELQMWVSSNDELASVVTLRAPRFGFTRVESLSCDEKWVWEDS